MGAGMPQDGSATAGTGVVRRSLSGAAGLGRDGVVGPKTRKALEQGVRPKAPSTDGHVVEINQMPTKTQGWVY